MSGGVWSRAYLFSISVGSRSFMFGSVESGVCMFGVFDQEVFFLVVLGQGLFVWWCWVKMLCSGTFVEIGSMVACLFGQEIVCLVKWLFVWWCLVNYGLGHKLPV